MTSTIPGALGPVVVESHLKKAGKKRSEEVNRQGRSFDEILLSSPKAYAIDYGDIAGILLKGNRAKLASADAG